jgi:hypothetical protein
MNYKKKGFHPEVVVDAGRSSPQALKNPLVLKKSYLVLDLVDVALACSAFRTFVALLVLNNSERVQHQVELAARSANVSDFTLTHHFLCWLYLLHTFHLDSILFLPSQH